MKWLYRVLIHTAKFLLIKIPMQLLGMVVLAPVLVFVPKNAQHLPKAFKWLDNADYYRKVVGEQTDGLSGDPGIRARWKNPDGWLARYYWLAIRNPINYFQYYKLGVSYRLQDIDKITYSGNRYTSDWIRDRDVPNNGLFLCEVVLGGRTYWEIYLVINHLSDRCLRLRLGWKINQAPEYEIVDQLVRNEHLQFSFNIHPFKEIEDRSN